MKIKSLLFTFFFLISLLIGFSMMKDVVNADVGYENNFYPNGVYTNLCGQGRDGNNPTSLTACGQGCNPATGYCTSSGGTFTTQYTCDGYQTECRQNEQPFANSYLLGNPGCGKTVQIDVYSQQCRVGGEWTCPNESYLRDYMVWYSGDCEPEEPTEPEPSNSCASQMPVNVQFRIHTNQDNPWISGNDMTNLNLQLGDRIDANCFSKNGYDVLEGGNFSINYPLSASPGFIAGTRVNNIALERTGRYTFTCSSSTIDNCSDTDSFYVYPADDIIPASCNNGCSASQPCEDDLECVSGSCRNPECTADTDCECNIGGITHRSSCDDLDVISGNNSTVPTNVTLRARGSDNIGSIQEYRFYYGDGDRDETSNSEITHTYDSSGTFFARVDIKDSEGNWKTSSSCDARVYVNSSPVESHRADCSDVHITASNGAKAPSDVSFTVTGYDNKGDIQGYRVNFGNGDSQDYSNNNFTYRYNRAGTYTIQAYIKDSEGDWVGGDDGCRRNLYINTQPLTKQPATGTPTVFSTIALLSGFGGTSLQLLKRKLS